MRDLNMITILSLVGLLLFGSLAGTTCMQKKLDGDPEAIPLLLVSENLIDNGDGTISDLPAGLQWKRCAQGQVYSAPVNDCIATGGPPVWGAIALAFCETATDFGLFDCTDELFRAISGPAFASCAAETEAGHADWRLPQKEELEGLTGLLDPERTPLYFPRTPTDRSFWSGTGVRDWSGEEAGRAYGVSFAPNSFGRTDHYDKAADALYVRCVRSEVP